MVHKVGNLEDQKNRSFPLIDVSSQHWYSALSCPLDTEVPLVAIDEPLFHVPAYSPLKAIYARGHLYIA